jgi:hypothetical protein
VINKSKKLGGHGPRAAVPKKTNKQLFCVCSIFSVISASYYSEDGLYVFVKLFKLCDMWKCTLFLALDVAFHGASEQGYKCENIIDFISNSLDL